MVDRHCRICDDIMNVSQEENSTIKISAVASILKAKNVQNMPEGIDAVTKALKTNCL